MATAKQNSSKTWDYTPVSATTAGDVVVLGTTDLIGVAVTDIAASKLGALYVDGVFEFPTASTFEQGDLAYYNATGDVITDDASDVYAGRVVSQPTATTVRVEINFAPIVAGS